MKTLPILFAFVPLAIHAQSLYEPFNYSVGSPLAGQGQWTATTTADGTIEEGSLTTAGLASAGNKFSWGSASMSLRLPTPAAVNSGSLYFSMELRVDSMGTSFTSGVATSAGFTTGTTTTFMTKVNLRPATGGYNIGVFKASGTSFGQWDDRVFAEGETVFLVGRYTFNTGSTTDDVSDLWINPSTSTFGAASAPTPSVSSSVTPGGTDIAQIDRVFLRAGGATSAPAKETADELRIGTTWAEVTTVPEPGTMALFGTALGALLVMRRKR